LHPLSEQVKLAAATAYVSAAQGNDGAALIQLAAPGAAIWHNSDNKNVTVEHTARSLNWVHQAIPDAQWTTVSLKTTSDGFVWQSTLSGTAPGGQVNAHLCLVVTLDGDGKFTRADEYLDSAQTAVMRG
jgi:hypothetical protein